MIDILQEYTARKRAEHVGKSVLLDAHGISCVSPKDYANRFVKAIVPRIVSDQVQESDYAVELDDFDITNVATNP